MYVLNEVGISELSAEIKDHAAEGVTLNPEAFFQDAETEYGDCQASGNDPIIEIAPYWAENPIPIALRPEWFTEEVEKWYPEDAHQDADTYALDDATSQVQIAEIVDELSERFNVKLRDCDSYSESAGRLERLAELLRIADDRWMLLDD